MSKKFLITARNKENSKFSIRNLGTKGYNRQGYKTTDVIKTENDIIVMINNGYIFYTINPNTDTLTLIVVVNNHIKSESNKTKLDNISYLPIKF